MRAKLILLVWLAVFAGGAAAQLVTLPASEDIYVDLSNSQIYNSQILRCELRASNDTIPGLVLVSFNISGIPKDENSIAILALKAQAVKRTGDGPAGIALLPIGSGWTEKSNLTQMSFILETVERTIQEGFLTDRALVSLDYDDWVFTFDVSHLLSSAFEDSISFALVPIHGLDYRVDFRSRETGEGPILMVVPFPSKEETARSEVPPQNLMDAPAQASANGTAPAPLISGQV
jgi:hypothetical protein